jgi:hypothetical protein
MKNLKPSGTARWFIPLKGYNQIVRDCISDAYDSGENFAAHTALLPGESACHSYPTIGLIFCPG